jgi:hypothetical protein
LPPTCTCARTTTRMTNAGRSPAARRYAGEPLHRAGVQPSLEAYADGEMRSYRSRTTGRAASGSRAGTGCAGCTTVKVRWWSGEEGRRPALRSRRASGERWDGRGPAALVYGDPARSAVAGRQKRAGCGGGCRWSARVAEYAGSRRSRTGSRCRQPP